ncbi:hypothetical protein JTE90_013263 [Oedothorax gibbosus]|uniref:Uncharacterized protein n=1 Tax=Oedothorax gibbosus TaxID=931172 RepID=A0AAV6VEA0_9ARAC|nr:hypothetical protein JTE90_013263 [Oedothorax gibbosus]
MGSSWSSTETEVPPPMASQRSSSTIQPNKLRNPGVTILKEILRTIKLDENLIAINNEILLRFLSSFIEEMKKHDELFGKLYQKNVYTGSFYSDLRISEPDEFDINLVLKMPFKPGDIEINYHPQVPSYAKFHLKNEAAMTVTHPTLVRKLFKDGYLMPEAVRKWIQSVVDKALQTYKLPHGITRIIPSSSGPARTIQLVKPRGIIDIDLVPVISCVMGTKQPGIDGRVNAKFQPILETFLVPKPYSPSGQAPVNRNEIPRLWRTHFPDAENKLIHDVGCVKPVIKLLKLLRDKENWKILASYYLKTVVMWMILENNDKTYWKEDKLDLRFIEALKRLAAFVKDRKIPYFFSKKYNLIEKMNENQAFNLYNRITALINYVEKDRTKLWDMFHVHPTF